MNLGQCIYHGNFPHERNYDCRQWTEVGICDAVYEPHTQCGKRWQPLLAVHPEKPMKIYLVFVNSDMTEGRGPMILHTVIGDKQRAIDFALAQPGVMGVMGRQRICNRPAKYGVQLVDGDWEVYEAELQ